MGSGREKNEEDGPGGAVLEEKKTRTKQPSMFRVLLHNDDFTPMDLVTEILMKFFDKSLADATHVMLLVHHKGRGIAGVYTREVAETKVTQVIEYARSHQAPLLCTMEEA